MIAEASGFFEKKDVRDLRKLDIVNFQNHLESKGIRGKYQKNYLDNFKTFLRWCKSDLEIIHVVPAFPAVQVPDRPYRWLAQEDQIELMKHIPLEDRPIIEFLMLHGCRPGEARALRVKDVDLRTETMTISSTFSGDTLRDRRKGRQSKAVTLPIHPECIDFVADRCRGALPGVFVFPNPRTGRPYTHCVLNRVWGRLRADAGISADLRLYDATRHSVATQLRLADVPLQDIKDQPLIRNQNF